jgi:hypothetical protein
MSKYFKIQEFVPSTIFALFGKKSWWFINPTMVAIADQLREDCGVPLICNNWHVGGTYQNRGYRTPQTTVGARYSQHRLGNALDLSSPQMTPAQMLQVIERNKEKYVALGLTTIEDLPYTPTWLHLDCRPRIEGVHPKDGFLFVQP